MRRFIDWIHISSSIFWKPSVSKRSKESSYLSPNVCFDSLDRSECDFGERCEQGCVRMVVLEIPTFLENPSLAGLKLPPLFKLIILFERLRVRGPVELFWGPGTVSRIPGSFHWYHKNYSSPAQESIHSQNLSLPGAFHNLKIFFEMSVAFSRGSSLIRGSFIRSHSSPGWK